MNTIADLATIPTDAVADVTGAYVTVRVMPYTYDLNDEGFRNYALRCGILRLAGEPDSPEWHFTANHQTTEAEINEHFRNICLDDDELRNQRVVITLVRGLLQYAWDEWSTILPF